MINLWKKWRGNWRLVKYVKKYSHQALWFTECYFSDPVCKVLIFRAQRSYDPLAPKNILIYSLSGSKWFFDWLRYKATPEDCIEAGFSEHEVMELFR